MNSRWMLLVSFALVGCGADPAEDLYQGQEAIPVEVATVTPRTLETDVRLYGVLESAEEVVVNVEFAAPVVKVLAEEGHHVAKGQPLLELDTSKLLLILDETKHLLEQAQVQLDNARLNLSRLEALANANTIAVQRYDDARFAHESAAARVRELSSRIKLIERDLDQQVVKSPLDAIVGVRHVEAGQSIMAYQPLMTLQAVQTMKVSVFASERQLPYLHVGNRGEVMTVFGQVDSVIHSISAGSDSRTGNYEIKLLLDNPDSRLKPGMTARVSLRRTPILDQLLIPDSALVAWNGRHVVYVARDQRAERQLVGVSVASDDLLVVEHGLEAGDQLIVEGARHVTQGSLLLISDSGVP